MPPKAAQSLESISLVGKAETAVIVGATTGIGAAIAKLYAKLGCRRIIIFGRNQARAEEVMTAMRNLAPEEGDVGVEFVKGDLS